MSEELELLKAEGRLGRKAVATFLHDLADKIAKGKVLLQKGDQQVPLDLPDSVTLEIEVEEEIREGRTVRSLEVEIEWHEGDESPSA
ncbi:MAG: amphi-Trp domain-containing protein [Anaerolineae bacterium]